MAVHVLYYSTEWLTILSVDDSGVVAIWNLDTGKLEQEITLTFNGPIVVLRWIPGKMDAFVIGCGDGCILIYAKPGPNVRLQPRIVYDTLLGKIS